MCLCMYVKFLSAILGPEMGASILWTPGKMRSFCRKKTHVHKIPHFRGGGYFGFWGGGGVPILFLWARGFFWFYPAHHLKSPEPGDFSRHRIWPDEGSTVQWKWSPPSPGSLKAPLFPSLLRKVQNKGTQWVRARYDAELPPFISIIRHPGRPAILGVDKIKKNGRNIKNGG